MATKEEKKEEMKSERRKGKISTVNKEGNEER